MGLTRAQQEAQDELLLTNNNNFENTPARHKQANQNMRNNSPCFDNDNFTIDLDGSHKYTQDPTTLWNNDPSHALKIPHKNWIESNFIQGQIVSQNIAFLDVTNGNDSKAQLGNIFRPFKTGIEIVNQLPVNGTIIILSGENHNLTLTKSLNVIGFGVGTKIGSVFADTGVCSVSNLEATSTTSFRVSGGAIFTLNNVIGKDCTGVVAAGDFKIYNSTLVNVQFFKEGTGNIITGVCSTKNEGNIKIWNNVFLNTFTLTYNTGGVLFNNTFNTGANQPIFFNKGFNTSQPTGKIDIYDNDILSSVTNAILENGSFTQPLIARLWNNRYETTNLFSVTVNNVTRNQYNNQLT